MAKDFNTILSEAQQIKNEIIEGANTALRTGTCLEDIVQRAESDEGLAAKKAITITAGNGLTGGGSLATASGWSLISCWWSRMITPRICGRQSPDSWRGIRKPPIRSLRSWLERRGNERSTNSIQRANGPRTA